MTDRNIPAPINLKQPYVWIATWFGAGFFRPAPGTWGSALSIPPALILFNFFGYPSVIIGIFIITALGFWAADKFDKAIGGHDNKMIVIDEAAGQWISLLPSMIFYNLNPMACIASFILFRMFDILKPWPVSYFDKHVQGAAGVMLDDIVAGIMAAAIIAGGFYVGIG